MKKLLSFIWILPSIQKITEKLILKITKNLKRTTKCNNLCLSGGVA